MTTTPGTTSGNSYAFNTPPSEQLAAPPDSYTHPFIALRELRDYTHHLAGRVKTLVDATIHDPVQRKAVIDLVHEMFWSEHYSAVMEWADIRRHRVGPDGLVPCFPFSSPV